MYNNNKLVFLDDHIELIKKHKCSREYRRQDTPKFVFLCGKKLNSDGPKTNRELVKNYYEKCFPNVFCFFAESLWKDDNEKDIDLLTFEDILAEISDVIIIFVESFGSICELGAFTLSKRLLSKLVVVCDKQFEYEESFINYGPLRKAKENKVPVIYTDINTPMVNMDFRNRLKEIIKKKERVINNDPNHVIISSFIIELLEILTICDPIKFEDLIVLYKCLKSFDRFKIVRHDKSPLNLNVSTIIKILTLTDIVLNDNGYLKLNKRICKNIDFSFQIPNTDFNKIRCRLLSRKLKFDYGM